MARLITARLPDLTADRIRQYARRKQRSVNETVAVALEEWLRQDEFAYIEFRDTPEGRMAFMRGSRLPVYWVVLTARGYGMDVAKTRAHWPNRPCGWVEAALNYNEAFPDEIDLQIAEHERQSRFQTVKRRLPQVEAFSLPDDVLKAG